MRVGEMAPHQSAHVTVQVWMSLFMTVHGVHVCVCVCLCMFVCICVCVCVCVCVKLSWIRQKLIAIDFCRQLGCTLDNTPTSKFTTPLQHQELTEKLTRLFIGVNCEISHISRQQRHQLTGRANQLSTRPLFKVVCMKGLISELA